MNILFRDRELRLIEKVGLTHNYQGGELNVSLVNINNCNTNNGYLGCVEKGIQALNLKEMEKDQTFIATAQTNIVLEGDFAIEQGISPLEFISSLYLFFCIVSYLSAKYLISYFTNFTNKQSYTFFSRYFLFVCLQQAND